MTVPVRMLSLAVVLFAAMLAAWCYPTLYGDTGLVLVPTADLLPQTYVNLAFNYSRYPTTAGGSTVYPVRLSYGASDNAEFFAFYASPSHRNEGSPEVLGGGFKFSIEKEDTYSGRPGLAVGARVFQLRDLPGSTNRDAVDTYGVISKTVLSSSDSVKDTGYAVRVHGGVTYTAYSGDAAGNGNFISGVFGVSYANRDGTNIVADYVPLQKENGVTYRNAALSAALRYPLSDNFMFEAGETQLYGLGDQAQLYAGILYKYGQRNSAGEYQRY